MTDFFNNLIEASKQDDFADVLERWMNTGVFKLALPEVHSMKDCEQPAKWHPEGNVWEHVLAGIRNVDLSEFDEDEHPMIRLSIFFHDIGKPTCKAPHPKEPNTFRYIGHDGAGLRIFEEICKRHDVTDEELINRIKFPIKNHMKLHLFDKMRQKKIDALVEDEQWPLLKAVGKADIYSRQFDVNGKPSIVDCDEEYQMLAVYPHKENDSVE